MAGRDDMIRSSVPGGNIGKPLMLALGALRRQRRTDRQHSSRITTPGRLSKPPHEIVQLPGRTPLTWSACFGAWPQHH